MPDPTERLNAALRGRYSIERELGEGGMATRVDPIIRQLIGLYVYLCEYSVAREDVKRGAKYVSLDAECERLTPSEPLIGHFDSDQA